MTGPTVIICYDVVRNETIPVASLIRSILLNLHLDDIALDSRVYPTITLTHSPVWHRASHIFYACV